MPKKKSLRKTWTPEDDAALMGYFNRGRSAATAFRTASVRLGRTFYACRARYYFLVGGKTIEAPSGTVSVKAEAVTAHANTDNGPVKVRIDGLFTVTRKGNTLHLSS